MTTQTAAWTDLDAGRRASLAIDGLEPRYHARPRTPEAVAEVLRQANEAGLTVAPVGGGTHLEIGNPPARLDLALETTALDRVVEYEPADLTVTVQAGMRFAELQETLARHGQFLALDPPALAASTIGGIIATNQSGPLRYAYGTARDLVIGVRVANPDGRLTKAGGRVVKNVAGYDLNKLYVGSLGTVGVIVELSFKLHPIPPTTALVVGRFETADAARAFVGAVVRSPLSPLAIELLRPLAADVAGIGRALCVAVRVGGYKAAVERQERDLAALVSQHGGQRLDPEEAVWEQIEHLALRAGPPERDVLVTAAVPIAQTTAATEVLERSFGAHEPVIWAHAGNGVTYAAFASTGGETAVALQEARRQVAALDPSASLVVQRCPTALKAAVDVWGDPGDPLRLMRAIKEQLDPKGTLNPGRYVGGI